LLLKSLWDKDLFSFFVHSNDLLSLSLSKRPSAASPQQSSSVGVSFDIP
jgi:hypothetical protein